MKSSYNFELNKLIETINKEKHKSVCLQLPDGLKPLAGEIQSEIERKTKSEVFLYAGSCWGGCDIPLHLSQMNIDLLVQFGHAVFRRPW